MLTCPVCNSDMHLFSQSTKYLFFNCRRCGFWTSRYIDFKMPYFEYEKAPDFVGRENGTFEKRICAAKRSLSYYFSLIGLIPKSFIDVGCSYGEYVGAAKSLGIKAFGIEVDSYKVECAKSYGLNVIKKDLVHDEFEFPKAKFILLRHVIEHIPEFLNLMEKASDHLEGGGILWVEVPNQGSIVNKIKANEGKVLHDERFRGALYPPTHINGFTKNTMHYIGKRLNLKVKRIITYSFYDDKWSLEKIQVTYKGAILKFLSEIGLGENIAVIYQRTN